jgi:hypothetical protein
VSAVKRFYVNHRTVAAPPPGAVAFLFELWVSLVVGVPVVVVFSYESWFFFFLLLVFFGISVLFVLFSFCLACNLVYYDHRLRLPDSDPNNYRLSFPSTPFNRRPILFCPHPIQFLPFALALLSVRYPEPKSRRLF